MATSDTCEECADPARQVAEPPVDRPLRVIHNAPTERSITTTCPHCADPLVYDDDRRDGYHTSNAKCVRAHKKGVA